ncbi:hypothetical protein NYZ99_11110 [Maribacter litopenaei]|uniref:DUF3098 domain-containing protein n=1 Tax=Maribacter litopenaei TaxID=2976127 RepID=A0ABY5Y4B8_9FLAO|nr:hypothetical protein [Maribacter litopenaei]UWX53704.1 hypothetical protein NYZ99_11110 [Maribacter litopenaei]
MAFEKYSTDQLKKFNKIILGILIFGVFTMSLIIGFELSKLSKGEEMKLIYLIPSVIAPILVVIPLLFSAFISNELKRRKNSEG